MVFAQSLRVSGFESLSPWVTKLWLSLVGFDGRASRTPSLLPGLLATILDTLTPLNVGIRESVSSFEGEKKLLRQTSWRKIGDFLAKLPEPSNDLEPWITMVGSIFVKNGIGLHQEFRWGNLELASTLTWSSSMIYTSDNQTIDSARGLVESAEQEILKLSEIPIVFQEADYVILSHEKLVDLGVSYYEIFYSWIPFSNRLREYLGDILPEDSDGLTTLDFSEPNYTLDGGYNDLETKGEGNWSSLLSTELAYVEGGSTPDYFDYKYASQTLFFFKRDEGEKRSIRRRIRCIFDLNQWNAESHEYSLIRNLGKVLGLLEVLLQRMFVLFQRDKLQVILDFRLGNKPLLGGILDVFRDRITSNSAGQENDNSNRDIRFQNPLPDGILWQEWTLTNLVLKEEHQTPLFVLLSSLNTFSTNDDLRLSTSTRRAIEQIKIFENYARRPNDANVPARSHL